MSDQKRRPKTKERKRFVEVDLYQKTFGPVSEKAVYDIYSQKFHVSLTEAYQNPFSDCVQALRDLKVAEQTIANV